MKGLYPPSSQSNTHLLTTIPLLFILSATLAFPIDTTHPGHPYSRCAALPPANRFQLDRLPGTTTPLKSYLLSRIAAQFMEKSPRIYNLHHVQASVSSLNTFKVLQMYCHCWGCNYFFLFYDDTQILQQCYIFCLVGRNGDIHMGGNGI